VFLALLALFFLSKTAPLPGGASLAGLELKTLGGAETVDLGKCPTPKCLTVYVSPWCGVCRRSTAFINELRKYLAANNVTTRVIVGRGRPENIESYAPEFGPGTLVDAAGAFPLQGGVPNFIISNAEGRVLKSQPGVPGIYSPPFPEDLMRQMGEFLGLP